MMMGDVDYDDQLNNNNNRKNQQQEIGYQLVMVKPHCSCHAALPVRQYFDQIYVYDKSIIYFGEMSAKIESNIDSLKSLHGLKSENVFINPNFTCDLFNELRNGPKQRVISYTLYGTKTGYYKQIGLIAEQAKFFFNEWKIRVHFDNTIQKDIICDIECKNQHVSFCNVHALPLTTIDKNVPVDWFKEQDKRAQTDMSNVHGMMRRWFPIGDDFVDFFSSRDTDSMLIQRERDSVDAWVEGNNRLFHIIRDNPYHHVPILGGLWGHANVRSRQSGYRLFNEFSSRMIQTIYNQGQRNPKYSDQSYLSNNVWPIARKNATVHDAYNCHLFGGPSEPFPTQRPTDKYCWVSCFYPCCDLKLNQTERVPDCPKRCRPKDHKDWTKC